tara:strand:+ start:296 stop:1501 length:1206 start_codon:yes stop_codon:yes gene_type:complete
MEFLKDTEIVIQMLMVDFKTFHKKKTVAQRKKTNKILKNIYDKINDANNKTRMLWDSSEIYKTTKNVNNVTIQDSIFLPEEICKYISTHIIKKISYTCKICNRDILFTFYIPEHDMFNKTDNITKKMIMWLFFILPYARTECAKTLKITSYLTPFKKTLPENNSTILGPKYVNTAFTYRCQDNGEIIIYRMEEIFKVFLHETFHTFGLDWSDGSHSNKLANNIKKLFPISSDMKIAESYCEFWACFMNSIFTAYHLTDGYNVDEFLIYSEYCLSFERLFSLLQTVKILRFMSLTYQDLHNATHAKEYKENTNVFVYYILKYLYLFNVDDFLEWCFKNNNNMIAFDANKDNFSKLLQFIKSRYNSKDFIHMLDYGNMLLDKHNNIFIKNTMRLSILDFSLIN